MPFALPKMVVVPGTRREVIALYKDLLRLSKRYEPVDVNDAKAQRDYIAGQTKYWFRKNRDLENEKEIRSKLEEARKRIEIAQHYGIAYERPTYYPTGLVIKYRHKNSDPISRQYHNFVNSPWT